MFLAPILPRPPSSLSCPPPGPCSARRSILPPPPSPAHPSVGCESNCKGRLAAVVPAESSTKHPACCNRAADIHARPGRYPAQRESSAARGRDDGGQDARAPRGVGAGLVPAHARQSRASPVGAHEGCPYARGRARPTGWRPRAPAAKVLYLARISFLSSLAPSLCPRHFIASFIGGRAEEDEGRFESFEDRAPGRPLRKVQTPGARVERSRGGKQDARAPRVGFGQLRQRFCPVYE